MSLRDQLSRNVCFARVTPVTTEEHLEELVANCALGIFGRVCQIIRDNFAGMKYKIVGNKKIITGTVENIKITDHRLANLMGNNSGSAILGEDYEYYVAERGALFLCKKTNVANDKVKYTLNKYGLIFEKEMKRLSNKEEIRFTLRPTNLGKTKAFDSGTCTETEFVWAGKTFYDVEISLDFEFCC